MWAFTADKGLSVSHFMCRTETNSETLQTHLWFPKGTGSGRNGLGVWDWHMHAEARGMIGQRGPAVKHREFYPIFGDHLWGKNLRENRRVYMYNCITLLYRRNYRNLVNQLYFKTTSKKNLRVAAVVQRKWIWLGTMRLWVRSLALLSRLRIWHCHELWCSLQMWLGCGVAVAVV